MRVCIKRYWNLKSQKGLESLAPATTMGALTFSFCNLLVCFNSIFNRVQIMALEINYTDKVLAGVNHSFTLSSDEGPPSGEVLVGGAPIPHRVVFLREPQWKVSFMIPSEAVGKELTMRFQAGGNSVDETKEIVGS